MCKACATLFYGTFVKAIPLFMAAEAWTRAKPVFVALDMINSRRSKGDLHVEGAGEGGKTIASLPAEVLDLVKKAVVDVEVEDAEEDLADRYRPDCSCHDGSDCFFPFVCECSMCGEQFDEDGGMCKLLSKRKKETQGLLQDSGLGWPGCHLLSLEGELYSDTDSLIALALPLQSRSRSSPSASPPQYPEASHEVVHEFGNSHSIAKINPAIFSLPHNTSSRFHRFLSLFDLRTYDVSASEIYPVSSVKGAKPTALEPKLPARTADLKPQPGPPELAWHVGSWSETCS